MYLRYNLNPSHMALALFSLALISPSASAGQLASTQSSDSKHLNQSAARKNIIQTSIELHHAYHAPPVAHQAELRKQQWWSTEYSRRQQLQRFLNWQDRKEATAYSRHMADPRSPEALGYKYIAMKAQAAQAKLPPEERTKIRTTPLMSPATPLAQIYSGKPAATACNAIASKRKKNSK